MKPPTPFIVASLALGSLFVSHQPAAAVAEPPSPATGHGGVVAQGVAEFTGGEFHWQTTTVAVAAEPTELDTIAATFVVSTGPGAIVLEADGGPVARLAPGEAIFRPAGATTVAHSPAPGGGTALLISAVAGPGDPTGTFTAGASTRDVDLVRDVLSTNEALLLRSDVAAFVAVTAGAVDAGGVAVAAGGSTPITGNVTLINTSPEPATVFVAVIGPSLDAGAAEPTTEPASTQPPATQPPAASQPTATDPPTTDPPTTAPPTTTPETTPPTEAPTTTAFDPTRDSDGDGLRDTDEESFGTDPLDSDTDNDGLPDGADRASGCDPTSYDSDGDGFSDGSEVAAGTNCAVPDNG